MMINDNSKFSLAYAEHLWIHAVERGAEHEGDLPGLVEVEAEANAGIEDEATPM